MKLSHIILSGLLALSTNTVLAKDKSAQFKSDSEIKQVLISESIASYSGNSPCPYNRAKGGSRCGKRSAYTKPGGYSPLCYDSDITPAMIKEHRKRNKN